MKKVFISAFFLFCGQYVQAMQSCLLAPGFLMIVTVKDISTVKGHSVWDTLEEGSCYFFKHIKIKDFLLVQVVKLMHHHDSLDYNFYQYTPDGQNFFTASSMFFNKIHGEFSAKKLAKKFSVIKLGENELITLDEYNSDWEQKKPVQKKEQKLLKMALMSKNNKNNTCQKRSH